MPRQGAELESERHSCATRIVEEPALVWSFWLSGLGELLDRAGGAGADEVVIGLKGEPELRGGPKGAGEQPSGFWRDTPLAANELVDPLDRDTQVPGEGDLGHPQRLEELLAEDLSWMGWCAFPRQHPGPPQW